MTHPLTPREKEAALKTNDPTNPAHRLAGDLQAGHFALGESRDDLIEVLSNLPRYAALASGSGDHAELARLKAAMSKSNDEICQSLGKALGYPWFKDDQRNFPGATEENGVCVGEHVAESIADEAAACIREMVEWRDIETAPRDGTVVIAMGRFPDATAGFPMFVHWHDGCWWVVSRNLTQPVVCWAWKPRDVLGDWPSELPFPPAPGAEDYV